MPKMKTSRAAAKRFKLTGTGKLKESKSLQEPYLNKEVHQEKEKSSSGSNDRCYQC